MNGHDKVPGIQGGLAGAKAPVPVPTVRPEVHGGYQGGLAGEGEGLPAMSGYSKGG